MFDYGREGEFGGGHSVGAGLARKMNRGCEADRGVFGVISPSLTRRVVLDFRRFKRDRRIAGSLQAFGPFLTDAQTPSGIIPRGEKKNWKMFRLWRRGGSCGSGRGIWLLGCSRGLRPCKGAACDQDDQSEEK